MADTRAEAALRFLADAGAALAESLDYQATLTRITERVVPFLADWCTVDVVDDAGVLRRVAAGHRDPAAAAALREIRDRQQQQWGSPQTSVEVLAAGRSLLFPDVTEAIIDQFVQDPEVRALVKRLGVTSGMAVPLRARGRSVGAMTFSSNTPGRRYDEADLSCAEELARRAAVAIDNARLYREAQVAVRVRDEFMAVASHELKNPLGALQLTVEALAEIDPARAPQAVTRTVTTLVRQTRRLAALVDQLLDVSRIEAGALPVSLETVDLVAVLREVLDGLAAGLDRAGCALTVRSPAQLMVRSDPARLVQVVGNLVRNAMTFGPGKPIDVTLEDLPVGARLTVEDHGVGIPPDRLPHVFERFERGGAVGDRGLGLGLHVVQQIAGALGGSVRAHSGTGTGARFVVELPRA
jgi:signal transduction histidine kinase